MDRALHQGPAVVVQFTAEDDIHTIPRPVVWALDEYLPVRTHKAPHSTETTGPLLVSRTGRGLDRVTFPRSARAAGRGTEALRKLNAVAVIPARILPEPRPAGRGAARLRRDSRQGLREEDRGRRPAVPDPRRPEGRRCRRAEDLEQADRPLKADGVFGKKTQAAVVAFQKKKNLKGDGVVGPKTFNALITGSIAVKPKPVVRGYSLEFSKNWKYPTYSELSLVRDGKVVKSWRAGSGMGSTDECASERGWL